VPRNVEVKARVESIEALRPRVAALADRGPIEIEQDDTFFACRAGRLKLRTLASDDGELIFYRRSDDAGPKESSYVLAKTSAPDSLRDVLARAYGRAGRVQKHRTLFLIGRTRVHLDRVSGLGDFLELEVVLEEGEPADVGVREADRLMARLGVQPSHLVQAAYVDLLAGR
jgi:predicted adenylyl cyclase CyaB